MHRAFRSLQVHTENRSDGTCTWAETKVKSVSDKIGCIPSKIASCRDDAELPKLTKHLRFDFGAFHFFRLKACHKYDVPSADAQRCKVAIRFFNHPAAAISLHCNAEFLTGCDADTANARTVFHTISNQCRAHTRLAAPVGAAKVGIILDGCNCFGQNKSPVLICKAQINRSAAFCP